MSEGTKTRLPIWLIVSLMANALLIGLLIGGGLGQRKAGPGVVSGGSEQALMRAVDRSVSSDQRREVRTAFRRAFADTRPERVRIRNARRELGKLLAARNYDAQAVEAAFAELREADAEMKARMHSVLNAQFQDLTPEQRRGVVRDMNRPDQRRGGPQGDRPPPPRPFRERNPD